MWDDKHRLSNKERNQLFDAPLARRAVCEVLNDTTVRAGPLLGENVHFVCCTVLHDGAEQGGAVGKGQRKGGEAQGGKGEAQGATTAHVGTHPLNIQAYMDQWQVRSLLAPSVVTVLQDISKRVQDSPEVHEEHVIATWCNAGEHRSVGVAEAILALAVALGMAVQGEETVGIKVREGFFP
jgi:hypothetical protein